MHTFLHLRAKIEATSTFDGDGDTAEATAGWENHPDLTRDSKGLLGNIYTKKKTKDWGRYGPIFL
jgi:hypothetical protein